MNQQCLNVLCIYFKFIITDKTALLGHNLPQKILPDYSFLGFGQSSFRFFGITKTNKTKQTLLPESASKLYRPSDRHLSAKLVPTFVVRGCHVVSVTNLDRSRYSFFQVAPLLYSQG
jgi:hypothetical protein